MKKVQGYLIALLSVLVLLAGCGKDLVKEDLSNYLNTELASVAPLEKEVIAESSSILGNNQAKAPTLYSSLGAKIVPKYEEYIKKLEQIKPATPEVQKLHAQYITAARAQLDAFKTIVSAIKKQDKNEAASAKTKLEAARKLDGEWKASLKQLADAHEVK